MLDKDGTELSKVLEGLVSHDRFTRLLASQDQPLKVWLREMDYPVLLLKQVFKNEDDSEGVRYLVASELTLSAAKMIGIYL